MLEALVDDSRELTPPRDVDLVVLEEKLEGSDSDDVDGTIYDLSCRFSPRDAMHGYGAERIGLVLSMSIWRNAISQLIKPLFAKILTAGS